MILGLALKRLDPVFQSRVPLTSLSAIQSRLLALARLIILSTSPPSQRLKYQIHAPLRIFPVSLLPVPISSCNY